MLPLQPRRGGNAEKRLHVLFVQPDGFASGCPELKSVEHLQSSLCTELSPNVREQFSMYTSGKRSGAGKKYWAKAGRTLGLIDTDDGIRFASDLVDFRQSRESSYGGRRPIPGR
jgi:hypothetical protein